MRSKFSMYCRDVFFGDEAFPGVLADEVGGGVAGDDFAGAVEADDAAGGVEDDDQRADGVEHGGDEVALDGQRGFDALAGAGGAVHLADAKVELQPGDDHLAERVERLKLRGGELAGGGVEHAEAADGGAGRHDDGRAGVEAVAAVAERDAAGGVVGVAARVGNLVDAVAGERGFAGQRVARRAGDVDAVARREGDAVFFDKRDGRHGGVGDLRRQTSDVVEGGVVRHLQKLVLFESLETRHVPRWLETRSSLLGSKDMERKRQLHSHFWSLRPDEGTWLTGNR